MALYRPNSQRKLAGTFLNDSIDTKLLQLSPPKQQCHSARSGIHTRDSTPESRTNFIGDSILSNDRPRALFVTKTGERQLLDLEVNPLSKTASTLNQVNSSGLSASVLEKISEKPSEPSLAKTARKSTGKPLSRKPKNFAKQNSRVLFTPRHLEASQVSVTKHSISRYQTTETQTDHILSNNNSCPPKQHIKSVCNSVEEDYIPTEGPRNCRKEFLRREQKYQICTAPQPSLEELTFYTKGHMTLFSVICSVFSLISSVLVLYWFLSLYFQIESLSSFLGTLVRNLQNLFSEREKPKTKYEIFVTFLREFWSYD